MTDYLYTVELGKTYGPKLERLAERASYDDREEFAAMVLTHAIDGWEEHDRHENEALHERLAQPCFFEAGLMRDPAQLNEDELPF
tara:strand:+ start:5768 stop:6022 length:255 start_codon:yes stop_codon:yes gene_type:complete